MSAVLPPHVRRRLRRLAARVYVLRERLETGEYDDADGRYYLAADLERLEAELAGLAGRREREAA